MSEADDGRRAPLGESEAAREDSRGESRGAGAPETPAGSLAYEQARLAYSIIETLLEHTRATSDLIALMAQALDEDVTKAVTETPHWAAYLESRRAMERTRADIERFAEEWTRMSTPGVSAGVDETPTRVDEIPTPVDESAAAGGSDAGGSEE